MILGVGCFYLFYWHSLSYTLHQTFANNNANKILMSQMTVGNAKSLMIVVNNNLITFHPHHITSQSHHVVDDCKRDTDTNHNTDDREVGIPVSTRDLDQCTHPNTTQSTHTLTPTPHALHR